MERKLEYYHIIIFLEGHDILYQERRGQMNAIMMEQFNSNQQHTNLKTKSVAYSSQGRPTGQLDFCHRLVDDSTTR